MRSFTRICSKSMDIWDPKLASFYKDMIAGGKLLKKNYNKNPATLLDLRVNKLGIIDKISITVS